MRSFQGIDCRRVSMNGRKPAVPADRLESLPCPRSRTNRSTVHPFPRPWFAPCLSVSRLSATPRRFHSLHLDDILFRSAFFHFCSTSSRCLVSDLHSVSPVHVANHCRLVPLPIPKTDLPFPARKGSKIPSLFWLPVFPCPPPARLFSRGPAGRPSLETLQEFHPDNLRAGERQWKIA